MSFNSSSHLCDLTFGLNDSLKIDLWQESLDIKEANHESASRLTYTWGQDWEKRRCGAYLDENQSPWSIVNRD